MEEKVVYCSQCGEKVTEGTFCPKCGAKVEIAEKKTDIGGTVRDRVLPLLRSKKVRIGILAVVAAFVVIALAVNAGGSRRRLQRAYEKYCSATFATLASDGSYLRIDTNPSDLDDYFNSNAAHAIEQVNEALGLSQAVYTRMTSTRALDGTQTATENGIEVSWHYHPDQGLEVIYSYE